MKRKFNLLELIVVIAIILTFVLTGMPKLLGHIQNAQMARDIYDAKVLHLAVETYYLENGDYPRLNNDPIDLDAVATQFYDLNGNPVDKALATANGEAWYDIDASLLADTVKLNQSSYKFLMQNPVSNVLVVDMKTATPERKALVGVSSSDSGEVVQKHLIDTTTYTNVFEVTTVEELVEALNTAQDGDVIAVAGGTYTIPASAVNQDDGIKIAHGVDLTGSGSVSNPTIINGKGFRFNGDNTFYGVVLSGDGHVQYKQSAKGTTSFYNSVLNHGAYTLFGGSGILGHQMELYYENCTVLNATSTNYYKAGIPILTSAQFKDVALTSTPTATHLYSGGNLNIALLGTTKVTTIDHATYTVAEENLGIFYGQYSWKE